VKWQRKLLQGFSPASPAPLHPLSLPLTVREHANCRHFARAASCRLSPPPLPSPGVPREGGGAAAGFGGFL
jgi:hypothetical protein